MKKKLVSALLCATMAASLLAGCGSGDTSDTGSSGKKGDAKTEVTNDGKILNIYCWNDEFQSRITDHYPDYKKVDATHGKIGDIDVVWNITPNENNAYQNNLDETLLKQADASACFKSVSSRLFWYALFSLGVMFQTTSISPILPCVASTFL